MSVPVIVSDETNVRLNEEHLAAMEGLRRARAVGVRAFVARFLAQPFAVAGLFLLGIVAAAAVFAPLIAPYDPFALNPPLQQPGSAHWLGTDPLGRDVLSQIIWGGRVSLAFAFGAAALSLAVGVVMGAIPGYLGGIVDDVFSRFLETFLVIPRLFLIILIVALLGSNLLFVIVVMGLTMWPQNAKIMRAQVLTIKKRGYVQAAIAAGVSPLPIIFRHVIPNGLAPVIANSTLQMAYAVLTEAGLSFLGLGDPNVTSWGQILNAGQSYVRSAPWIVISPGLAIMTLLLGLHLVGDGVTRVLNPRLSLGRE
jgi:peptide/nickel transport system permease protein